MQFLELIEDTDIEFELPLPEQIAHTHITETREAVEECMEK